MPPDPPFVFKVIVNEKALQSRHNVFAVRRETKCYRTESPRRELKALRSKGLECSAFLGYTPTRASRTLALAGVYIIFY